MLRMTASVMTMILMRLTAVPLDGRDRVAETATEGCILSAQNLGCQRPCGSFRNVKKSADINSLRPAAARGSFRVRPGGADRAGRAARSLTVRPLLWLNFLQLISPNGRLSG